MIERWSVNMMTATLVHDNEMPPRAHVCLSSDVARLEQALRESVAMGLRHAGEAADWCGCGERECRPSRRAMLLRHWSQAARAGRLDWAIREAMG